MDLRPDLIELGGASGKRYRFKRVADPAQLPIVGGNFVYVKHAGGAPSVIGCGASESLKDAEDLWRRAVAEHGAEDIYVRLNVNRTHRLMDHEDLSLATPAAGALSR